MAYGGELEVVVLRPDAVAKILGCSVRVVEGALRRGELKGVKAGGKWYTTKRRVEEWVSGE